MAGVRELDGAGWAPRQGTPGASEWETTAKASPPPASSDPPGSARAFRAEPWWAEAGPAAEKQGGEPAGRQREGMGTAGQPPPAAASLAAPPCGRCTQLRRAGNKAPGGGGASGSARAGGGAHGRGPRAGVGEALGLPSCCPGRGLGPGSAHAPLERNCDSSLSCWRLHVEGQAGRGGGGDTPPTGRDRPAPQKLQCERRAAGGDPIPDSLMPREGRAHRLGPEAGVHLGSSRRAVLEWPPTHPSPPTSGL